MFQFYHRICVSGKKSPRRGTVKSLSGVSSSLAEVAEGPNPGGARGAATPRTSALHARLRPPAPACSACLAAVTAPGPPKRACHSAVHGMSPTVHQRKVVTNVKSRPGKRRAHLGQQQKHRAGPQGRRAANRHMGRWPASPAWRTHTPPDVPTPGK